MLAVITMELEKPTRFGRDIIEHKINAPKGMIKTEVNGFIFDRERRKNLIRVICFDVKILDYKKRVIDKWNYKPTYRE